MIDAVINSQPSLRACLKKGWHGRPARAGRRPADRNERGCADLKADLIGWRCPSRSVRRVAGRHRPVACATKIEFSDTLLDVFRVPGFEFRVVQDRNQTRNPDPRQSAKLPASRLTPTPGSRLASTLAPPVNPELGTRNPEPRKRSGSTPSASGVCSRFRRLNIPTQL